MELVECVRDPSAVVCKLIRNCYIFSMVTLRELPVSSSGTGEGSGSGYRVGQLDDQMRNFISAEIMRNIIDQTLVIFGSVREAIVELMDNHLEAIRAGIVSGQFGARLDPDAYGV